MWLLRPQRAGHCAVSSRALPDRHGSPALRKGREGSQEGGTCPRAQGEEAELGSPRDVTPTVSLPPWGRVGAWHSVCSLVGRAPGSGALRCALCAVPGLPGSSAGC